MQIVSSKKILLKALTVLCTLMLSMASFSQTIAAAESDFSVTQSYYNKLINKQPVPVAQLNLFANQLPKGGDLHHHYSGSLYAETYLDWVEKKGLCILRDSFKINFDAQEQKTSTQEQKKSTQCLTAAKVRADEIFYRQLLSRWSDKDFSNHFHDTLPPDLHFFGTFQYFTSISKAYYKEGLQLLKNRAKNENLQYIETMFVRAPDGDADNVSRDLEELHPAISYEQMRPYLDAEFKRLDSDAPFQASIQSYIAEVEEATADIDDAEFTLRAQTYVFRNASRTSVFSSMYSGFKAATQSRKIVGVNIVGPENGVIAMRDYSLHMQMFKYLKSKYPDVRLSLHAGELSLGMVPPEGLRHHITEAVGIAGAKRIGHGIDLMYESDAENLLKTMLHNNIAVEINLTSNEFIAGVSGQSHPLTIYMQRDIPFVISTDDEGVSRSTMSNEYLLFLSRYKPSYSSLKKTIYNSIQYSFLNTEEKLHQKKLLDQRFSKFESETAQAVKQASKDLRRLNHAGSK